MGDSHYYKYKFERGKPPCSEAEKQEGLECRDSYTITASGYLNCNGTFSTFINKGFGYSYKDNNTLDC